MNQVVVEESQQKIETVIHSRQFRYLVKVRNSTRYLLTVLVVAIHAFFIGGIAFYNDWFAHPYADNSVIPNGIFFTVLVIFLMLVLEFIYIFISDNKLEKLQKKVIAEVINNE